jgi:hypothetical protein
MNNLQTLLSRFVIDPENDYNNLWLAKHYHSIGQTASAVSYYLRTAERTKDKTLMYACLLISSDCFHSQGCRNDSVKGLLQSAIALCPKRPEGYFLLSRFYERVQNWHDSYLIASIGIVVSDLDCDPLPLVVDYPGKYGILFEKAVSSWHCGLCDESRDLLIDLKENYELDEIHARAVDNNIKTIHPNYKNTKISINKDRWKNSIAPTMEFTTSIDTQNGCVVDCVFCPQRTLQKSYKGERFMTLDNFKKAVDKLPQEVRVTFAGFTEPWLNRDCTDMVLYAHETGHPISIFTTGIGMSINDIERIKHIPFAGNPNGCFTLHLPDQERKAKHPITKRYIELIEHLGKIQHEIHNFTTMCMGAVHEDVKHVFSDAPVYDMWSRAGNLVGEMIMKPELLERKEEWKMANHGEKQMTCGCLEKMYHNVMLPNGDVSLCCMDYGLKHILGNLYEEDYEEIIPQNNQCFELCRLCENAVEP